GHRFLQRVKLHYALAHEDRHIGGLRSIDVNGSGNVLLRNVKTQRASPFWHEDVERRSMRDGEVGGHTGTTRDFLAVHKDNDIILVETVTKSDMKSGHRGPPSKNGQPVRDATFEKNSRAAAARKGRADRRPPCKVDSAKPPWFLLKSSYQF